MHNEIEIDDKGYILRHWGQLAVIAYDGYLQHGQGAVYLLRGWLAASLLEARSPENLTIFNAEFCFYFSRSMCIEKDVPISWTHRIMDQMEDYDPASSFLLIINDGWDIRVHHVKDMMGMPKDAHIAAQKASAKESSRAQHRQTPLA